MTRVRWRCCRGDGGDVVWPASHGVLGCRKRSRTVAVAPAGERTSGDRRKAASPATGDPPLSLRLLEPPCLPFRWPPPVPDGSGSQPSLGLASTSVRALQRELSPSPLPGGGRLPWSGTSPAPVPFPAQRWPPFANPPLTPALRQKAQRPLSELAVPAGQRGSCPLPATFPPFPQRAGCSPLTAGRRGHAARSGGDRRPLAPLTADEDGTCRRLRLGARLSPHYNFPVNKWQPRTMTRGHRESSIGSPPRPEKGSVSETGTERRHVRASGQRRGPQGLGLTRDLSQVPAAVLRCHSWGFLS